LSFDQTRPYHFAQMDEINLKIAKQSDRQWIEGIGSAVADANLQIQRWSITTSLGGNKITVSGHSPESNEEVNALLGLDGEVLKRIDIRFNIVKWEVGASIERHFGELRDAVQIDYRPIPADAPLPARLQALQFVKAAQARLKSIDREHSLFGISDAEVRRYYDSREDALMRLEGAIADLANKVAAQAVLQRAQLDHEFAQHKERLQQELDAERKQLQVAAAEKESSFAVREEDFQKRLEKIDDRESRHVRRQIREDLKEELKQRSQSFSLTAGTNDLRRPVFWFSVVLLVIFGLGFVGSSIWFFYQPPTTNQDLINSIVRQLAFGAAFGTTAVFFLRWNNQWFEKHADEEFRLKRLHLDLDRASWVVGMAMEWTEEKGGALPAPLVDRLTADLFSAGSTRDRPLHPADQVSSALFGAAAKAHVQLPGGTSLELDRKGIREVVAKEGGV
jgi:hypothetical protein